MTELPATAEPRPVREDSALDAPPVAVEAPLVVSPPPPPERAASPALPEPPPVAAPALDPAVSTSSATAEVEAVLARYRAAFAQLDASSVAAVWPSVDSRALARAFRGLEQQQIAFGRCAIETFDSRATATCGGTVRYIPRVGGRTEHVERRRWHFTLRRLDTGWIIDTVASQ